MIIFVRLVPNTSKVLKRVQELEDVCTTVMLKPETINVIFGLKIVVLEFEVIEVI